MSGIPDKAVAALVERVPLYGSGARDGAREILAGVAPHIDRAARIDELRQRADYLEEWAAEEHENAQLPATDLEGPGFARNIAIGLGWAADSLRSSADKLAAQDD